MKIEKTFTFISCICFILIFSLIFNMNKPIIADVHTKYEYEDMSYITKNNEISDIKFMNLSYSKTEQESETEIENSVEITKLDESENIPIELTIKHEEVTTIIEEENTEYYQTDEIMSECDFDNNVIKTYSVPKGHSFKSYTNYKLLNSNSPQGKLQKSAHTDSTGIRMVGEYYCAALGTYYEGNIGDKYLVTLEDGKQFKMILCDVKSDAHTDSKHQYTRVNGCVIEFYVDYSVLSSYIRSMGDISYIDGFKGEIIQIQKISC